MRRQFRLISDWKIFATVDDCRSGGGSNDLAGMTKMRHWQTIVLFDELENFSKKILWQTIVGRDGENLYSNGIRH
jgi:hypothetical protein